MPRLCFESHRLKEQDGRVWALEHDDGSWTLHREVKGPGWKTVYVGPRPDPKTEPCAWIEFESDYPFSVESAAEGTS